MTDRSRTAAYLAKLAQEMAAIAKRWRLNDLAFVLSMAELQAMVDTDPQG